MLRVRRLGGVAAVAFALALTVIASAGATEPGPKIGYCHWWPGFTRAHWDGAYLKHHYGSSRVVRVEFVWFATFGITYTQSVSPVGDNAHGLTPIGANFVRATVYLDNGLGESTGPILHSCELGTGHH